MKVGAYHNASGGCDFRVWAPLKKKLELHVLHPFDRIIPLQKDAAGYWSASVPGLPVGSRYRYVIDGIEEYPDPASHYLPEGVHGVSEVIDHSSFVWSDASWTSRHPRDFIIYELHLGTFTPEGTFDAAAARLKELAVLGITAVELMPVTAFPGSRNWGYDGVYPFSVHQSYGGPEGFKSFVDTAHNCGLSVILDVVFNHLGPEGNYLSRFGPYFTRKYATPWGEAINYDDRHSEGVRNFFVENAVFWLREYHVDVLRLDAVHGIYDGGTSHILADIAEAVDRFSVGQGRQFYLTAESDLNDTTLIRHPAAGGYGLDAQWNDDFHHSLHVLLTGESNGYYADFGSIDDMKKALEEGFVYSGQHSAFRGRPHGNSSRDVPAQRLIVFSQNHDQTGNRPGGQRLSSLLSYEGLKLAAGAVILSPYIPLIFMGEEYAETNPFLYFVSHSDNGLIAAVREGRKRETSSFHWKDEPPDPQAPETFFKSKLNWGRRFEGVHKVMHAFYAELIRLRKGVPALAYPQKDNLFVSVEAPRRVLTVRRSYLKSSVICVLNFEHEDAALSIEFPQGVWRRRMDSSDAAWKGPGSYFPEETSGELNVLMRSLSFAVYERKDDS